MTNTDQLRASEQINLLAIRNSWPLICDPLLDFATPELKSALAIWQAKRGSRTMPTRDDMNFRDLKTFLPHLAFLTIVRDGARVRFKVRLAGSALDTFLGGSTTGRFVDEAVPQRFAEKWAAMWIPTIDSRAPTRTVGRAEMPGRGYYISESLHAPLAEDGETPDVMMLVAYFHAIADDRPGEDIAARLLAEIGDRAKVVTH